VKNLYLLHILFITIIFLCCVKPIHAQIVNTDADEYYFKGEEYAILIDKSGKLKLKDILTAQYQNKFQPNTDTFPTLNETNESYWVRLTVDYTGNEKEYALEILNNGLESVTAYIPQPDKTYKIYQEGSVKKFRDRIIIHKNFIFKVPSGTKGKTTYFFNIKNSASLNLVIAHKSWSLLIEYAASEYLFFGIFYGMVFILSIYNLILFIAMRNKHYLYYVLYILAVGLFQISVDGLAFQYLWPNEPLWNKFAPAVWITGISVFTLLFASDLLQLKAKNLRLYWLLQIVIFLRISYFIVCFLFYQPGLSYTFIEILPLLLALYAGIETWRKGYKPARLFILAYAFLLLGIIAKVFVNLGYGYFISGPLPHYSMSIGFILEMILFSFAIGNKVSILKAEKEKAQLLTISQMQENAKLKDEINKDLEEKVKERTTEIVIQANEIMQKSLLIEQQNEELVQANILLKNQSEEIADMNLQLEKDKSDLVINIEKVNKSRALSSEMSFEEFSKEFKDNDACLNFIASVKWPQEFKCKKCGNAGYWAGTSLLSRKCTNCKYDESVLVGTLLEGSRIPLNKALYIIYLVYTSKGKISSYKLSELLGIRQSTCWMYSDKIRKTTEDRKKELRNAGDKGWSKLIFRIY
jgi:hypothetical protein